MLAEILHALENRADEARDAFARWTGKNTRIEIQPRASFANAERVRVEGRLLPENPVSPDHLLPPKIPIEMNLSGRSHLTFANREGHFRFDVPSVAGVFAAVRPFLVDLYVPEITFGRGGNWHGGPASATATVYLPSPKANFGIIGDLDLSLEEEWVPAFYDALARGSRLEERSNPFFYFGSSPWSEQAQLADQLRLRELPPGPLFLDEESRVTTLSDLRLESIRSVLSFYPGMRFVVLAKATREAIEALSRLLAETTGRFLALHLVGDSERCQLESEKIRDLGRQADRQGIDLVVAEDLHDVVHHAGEIGLITSVDRQRILDEPDVVPHG